MKPESKGRGIVVPVIDLNRCEGKAACAAVCPYGVFQVRTIDKADYQGLSFLGRLRNRVHRGRVAYADNADACEACALCVAACPERAITLLSVAKASPQSSTTTA
jgi:4Fe-4S ferredoxin